MTAKSTATAGTIHGPLTPPTNLDEVSAVLYQSKAPRRPSPPASLAITETPSKREKTDSGYGSKASSPYQDQENLVEHSKGKIFNRKVTKLKPFDKQVPQPVQDRFHDLNELFSKPLYDYLSKAKVGFSAISIKLKVLGESEATAKPWIVVLCDKAVYKKVKQFFDQKQVKLQYRPCETDLDLPSFEIVYYSRPPRQIAANDAIYGEAWGDATTFTLCGKAIQIGEPEKHRLATLGGIVKVVISAQSFMLYGMTAGHIIARDWPEENVGEEIDGKEIDGEESDGEESDDEESDSEEETFEVDLTPDEDQVVQEAHSTRDVPLDVGQTGHLWSKIGHVSDASSDCYADKCNLDWALVKIDNASFYRPNLLVPSDVGKSDLIKRQLREPCEAVITGSDRDVFVVGGTSGFKQGRLSLTSSFLMLAPGNSFAKTHDLALLDSSALKPGDSGSWVVDAITYEVYGHIVASDAFGEAYVIPLCAALRQMEKHLGVKSVSLPTGNEVNDWLQRHCGTRLELITPLSTASLGFMPPLLQNFVDAHEASEARRKTEPGSMSRLRNNQDGKSTNANQPTLATKRKPKKWLRGFVVSSHLRQLKTVWGRFMRQKNSNERLVPNERPSKDGPDIKPSPSPRFSGDRTEDSSPFPLSNDQLMIQRSASPTSDGHDLDIRRSRFLSIDRDSDDCSQSSRGYHMHDSGYSSKNASPGTYPLISRAVDGAAPSHLVGNL